MRLTAAVLPSLGLIALALLPVGSSVGLGLKTTAFQPIPSVSGATRKACTSSCRPNTQLRYSPKDLLSKLRHVASSVLQTRKNVNKKVNARTSSGLAGAKAMFTGIVEEMGEVDELMMDIKTPGVTLTIKGSTVLDGAYEGCSIAVNGVCLTVTVTLPSPAVACLCDCNNLGNTIKMPLFTTLSQLCGPFTWPPH
jgi:hypothetical protein